jgi:phage terminase large subunit-like protein
MCEAVVRAAASDAKLRVNLKEVRASRGKVVRAEPVSSLYDQGKVHHVGSFPQLEDQLCAFTTNGFMGDGSPDRADALIWGLTEIFPRVVSRGDGDWKSTRPHRDRPKFANVGYAQTKGLHFQRNGGSQR